MNIHLVREGCRFLRFILFDFYFGFVHMYCFFQGYLFVLFFPRMWCFITLWNLFSSLWNHHCGVVFRSAAVNHWWSYAEARLNLTADPRYARGPCGVIIKDLQNSEEIFHDRSIIRFHLPFHLNPDPNLYRSEVVICVRGNIPWCSESDACSTCDSRRSVCMCECERDVRMISVHVCVLTL